MPWPYFDIRSCCHQSVRAFTSRYVYLAAPFLHRRCFVWDIITIVRFMHCNRSRIIDSHTANSAEVDRYISQCTFFHWLCNLHWIFNLKQEMQQICYINLNIIGKCDCLSKNPPSLHLPVFWEIPFWKFSWKNQPCFGIGLVHWA